MNSGRRDFEVALEVSLCRWTTVHFRVRVEEGEILALQVCEVGHPRSTYRSKPLELSDVSAVHPNDLFGASSSGFVAEEFR
jgi:hypothetical protein